MGTFLGIQALIDPSSALAYVDGAEILGIGWGGRNMGLGVALVLAVFLRNANAYVVALAASLFRELSDIIGTLPVGGATVFGLSAFLILEIICLIVSLRAALQNNSDSIV